jgi:hypothetical protein
MGRRVLSLGLGVLLALLGTPPAIGASAETNQLLADSELYARMKRELKERLAREERLTLLPRNLDGVSVSVERQPVFWMHHSGVGLPGVEAGIKNWRENHGGFRFVCDGQVLGASETEVILAAHDGHATRKCAVASAKTDRRFDLFVRDGECRAVRTPFGWWLRYDNGRVQTNMMPAQASDFHGVSWMMNGTDEVLLVLRQQGGMASDLTTPVTVVSRTRQGLTQEVFIVGRREALARQGVLRLRDGRWLSLDYCLRVLVSNTPPKLVAEETAAVIAAAKAGDRAAFFRALEPISGRHPSDTKALCDELAAWPEPGTDAEALETRLKYEIEHLRNWTPPPDLPEPVAARARAAVSNHLARLERSRSEVQASLGGPLGIRPAQVADLVRRCFQYFDGRWIQDVRVIRQDRAGEALVQATFLDEAFKPRLGIFRIDQDRHLTLLGTFDAMNEPEDRFDRASPAPACQSVRRPDGSEWLFFRQRGLAQLAGGSLEWVDVSAPFKLMREVLGCDATGRIYLASDPVAEVKSGNVQWQHPKRSDFWVYRPKARALPSAVARLYPVNSRPVMDREQRVWFVPPPQLRYPLTNDLGSFGDLEPARVATRELLNAAPMELTRAGTLDRRRDGSPGWLTGLFCYEKGRCLSVLTNVPSDLLLLNGSEGAVFGASRSDYLPTAFLIHDDSLTVGTNLHAMATNRFEQLLKLAPAEGVSPRQFLRVRSGFYSVPRNVALYRCGDVIWINQAFGIEAYCQGRPLGVGTRLALMNTSTDGAVLLGPLHTAAGPAQVILGIGAYGAAQVVWADPRPEGVDLRRGGKPDFSPIGPVGYTPIYDFPAGVDLAPVASLAGGRIFAANNDLALESSGPTNFVFHRNAGQPVLATRAGELIVETVSPAFAGYRLCVGEARRDLVETYVRPLRLLEETAAGDLLASNAEGLLWLRRNAQGDYTVRREAKLHLGGEIHSLVGETADQLFVTVMDRRDQAYLAVIQKLLLP